MSEMVSKRRLLTGIAAANGYKGFQGVHSFSLELIKFTNVIQQNVLVIQLASFRWKAKKKKQEA